MININNQLTKPSSEARQILESYIPFGSEWVIFTETYENNNRVYTCYYKPLGADEIKVLKVNYHYQNYSGSYYTVDFSSDIALDTISVSNPYYSYSNIKGCGVYESLPSTDSLICFTLIVISCLLVLRTVFGGIKLWSEKLRRY